MPDLSRIVPCTLPEPVTEEQKRRYTLVRAAEADHDNTKRFLREQLEQSRWLRLEHQELDKKLETEIKEIGKLRKLKKLIQ